MQYNMEEYPKEYFIRHTEVLELDYDDLKVIADEHRFGIHFESKFDTPDELLDESKYETSQAKTSIRYLKEISVHGGYVWAEYSKLKKIIIGYVIPGTKIEIKEFIPNIPLDIKIFPKGKLFLKTLRFSIVQEIKPNELLMLKVRRPRQGTFVRWRSCQGKLTKVVKNGISNEIKEWTDLTSDLQEVVSFEYLREVGINGWKLQHLLMPIGRTMKDIDIYAMNTKNEAVFIQVTHLGDNKNKLKNLESYESNLIYITSDDTLGNNLPNVTIINTKTIFEWLNTKTEYLKLLSI
ncbi:hypothetical protein [Leptospira levettii]|uniref:hypothetical protein n=1 Tax=Leptospira levettii TaxID=2023178 RepID=UPI00223E7522|nr:hypothetical protein [Leptospira levettii]MCW7472194.1 hypothetical protein [Leptospira levettii]